MKNISRFLIKMNEVDSGFQVFLFPFLGGSRASFMELARKLPSNIEVYTVNPPGHGGDNHKLLDSIDLMVDLYWKDISAVIKPASLFIGHSMGAIVAHKMIVDAIDKQRPVLPKAVILSAANAPDYYAGYEKKSQLDKNEFIQYMLSLNGLPKELETDEAMLDYFLTIFRADQKALENVTFRLEQIEFPVYLFCGAEDPFISRFSMQEWNKFYQKILGVFSIQGGHFFIQDNPVETARYITQIVQIYNK